MIAVLFSSFYIWGSDVLERSDRTNCSLWLQLDYIASEGKQRQQTVKAHSICCFYRLFIHYGSTFITIVFPSLLKLSSVWYSHCFSLNLCSLCFLFSGSSQQYDPSGAHKVSTSGVAVVWDLVWRQLQEKCQDNRSGNNFFNLFQTSLQFDKFQRGVMGVF